MGKHRRPKKDRTIIRRRKIDPETMAALDEQRELFKEKFGREMGPDDPFLTSSRLFCVKMFLFIIESRKIIHREWSIKYGEIVVLQ